MNRAPEPNNTRQRLDSSSFAPFAPLSPRSPTMPFLDSSSAVDPSAMLAAILRSSGFPNTNALRESAASYAARQRNLELLEHELQRRNSSSSVYPTALFDSSPEQELPPASREALLASLRQRLFAEQLANANSNWLCPPRAAPAGFTAQANDSRKRSRAGSSSAGVSAPGAQSSPLSTPATQPSRYRYMCKHPNCGKGAKAGGRCISHGGGKRCVIPGCGHIARFVGGRCHLHRDAVVPVDDDVSEAEEDVGSGGGDGSSKVADAVESETGETKRPRTGES
jgi:hypothetical protein